MKALRRLLVAMALLSTGFGLGGYAGSTWAQRTRTSAETAATTVELPPRCWEAVVYLPVVDNQGKVFSEAELQAAISILVNNYGGATVGEQREGYWLDATKKLRREQVRPVSVSFGRDRLAAFRGDVRAIGRALGQECMYVRLEEPRVELIDVAQDLSANAK